MMDRLIALTSDNVDVVALPREERENAPVYSLQAVVERPLGSSVWVSRACRSRGREITFRWQDPAGAPPQWVDSLVGGLSDVLTLPRDWDSYGSDPISDIPVRKAFCLMLKLMPPDGRAPWVVPLSEGGIQLEWHREGAVLEIEIDSSDSAHGYWYNPARGEECDLKIPDDEDRIKSYIAWMQQLRCGDQ